MYGIKRLMTKFNIPSNQSLETLKEIAYFFLLF
ncbi:hypothetical protein J2S06_002923 [Bacillus alveayuensis]|uniref:Uncharacterized protein n=1 Tax=Aeribacillus alveayuensis TaxID=279215 RepID=A0ABT9VS48_9BACI|nr:hypothetical protein [Bacillus alveayuensis]